jgi:hypothetical protein
MLHRAKRYFTFTKSFRNVPMQTLHTINIKLLNISVFITSIDKTFI